MACARQAPNGCPCPQNGDAAASAIAASPHADVCRGLPGAGDHLSRVLQLANTQHPRVTRVSSILGYRIHARVP